MCVLGIENIIKAQPQASGVPEEEERKKDGERAPQDQLLSERHADDQIKRKISRDHEYGGDRIIDIDGSNEVSLLSFELEIAGQTMRVHGETAAKQGCGTTSRASQVNAPAHNLSDALEIHLILALEAILAQTDSVQ
jgi:hypothetical protein